MDEHLQTESERVALARAEISESLVRGAPTKNGPGAPIACLENLDTILSRDPVISIRIGFDEFRSTYTWDRKATTDEEETLVNMDIQIVYGLRCPTALMREAFCAASRRREFHPVRDYLGGLVWDGVPRADSILLRYAGAADTALNRALGRRWLRSCVARVLEPGCKVDTVLILVGPQGAGKSSFFRAMMPRREWFSDTPIDFSHKDAYAQMQGIWVYELAELGGMRARDAETIKAFLAAGVDRFRPPYARNVVELTRQNVFVGSTNEDEFLDDPTGARRFWPVRVGEVDLEAVKADRDQLWAEVYEEMTPGVGRPRPPWWLSPEEDAELADDQVVYTRGDPWGDIVAAWTSPAHVTDIGVTAADIRDGVTVAHVLGAVLAIDVGQQHKAAAMRVAGILTRLGWRKKKGSFNGRRESRWFLSTS
jgi:putative DNA primase/helicase